MAKHDKLDTKEREEAAKFYTDAAMKLLHEAVSKGFDDVAEMKKNSALDPLRGREDFRAIIAKLEGTDSENLEGSQKLVVEQSHDRWYLHKSASMR